VNKKAQFFILVAVIVCMILFLLVQNYNYVMESVGLEDFQDISAGYNRETPKVINYAIFQAPPECADSKIALTDPRCPAKALSDFSDQYVKYGQTKDPNYGLVWMYVLPDGKIVIKNLLSSNAGDSSIILTAKKTDPNTNAETVISGADAAVLLSDTDTSTGSICINGLGNVGCGSAKTSVSNFGQSLTQAQIEGADKLIIKINGEDISINIAELQSGRTFIQASSDDFLTNIDVLVCPGGNGC